jgi:hypothetical protein
MTMRMRIRLFTYSLDPALDRTHTFKLGQVKKNFIIGPQQDLPLKVWYLVSLFTIPNFYC